MAFPSPVPHEARVDGLQDVLWTLAPTSRVGPQIYAILRSHIVRGDLTPGAALSEAEIAQRFSTSRQPVREAFIKLSEEGLLEVRPQRGTFVRKIDKVAIADARFVRESIEADIVKELATAPDAELVTELRAQLAAQAAVPMSRIFDFLKLDEQFHKTLAVAARRAYGWKVIEGVKVQMDRVRYLSLRTFPKERLVRQHLAIVDAIERAKPDEADREMRAHLRLILNDLPLIEEQHPEFFTSPGEP
jgi:GntR family transcriptional regulator, rspAB operon transcriptional repressor